MSTHGGIQSESQLEAPDPKHFSTGIDLGIFLHILEEDTLQFS
jgi:hypothetical protein